MKPIAAFIFASLLLTPLTSLSDIALYGATEGRCGAYLEYRRTGSLNAEAQVFYVWGFASAYNAYAPTNQINVDLPVATIHAYLEKYCRDNPLQTTAAGAIMLIRDLTGAVIPKRGR